jgi:hypothetical protein
MLVLPICGALRSWYENDQLRAEIATLTTTATPNKPISLSWKSQSQETSDNERTRFDTATLETNTERSCAR